MPSRLAASATEEFPAFLTVPRPRRIEVGHPHHIVLHNMAEKHAVDVRVIDAVEPDLAGVVLQGQLILDLDDFNLLLRSGEPHGKHKRG